MSSMGLVRAALAAAALALAGLAAGCSQRTIAAVKPGMMFTDVESILGKPAEEILGSNIDTGKAVWVYPQGKVFFDGCTVIKVEPAGADPAGAEGGPERKSR